MRKCLFVAGWMVAVMASPVMAQGDQLANADRMLADAAAAHQRVIELLNEQSGVDDEAARRLCIQTQLRSIEGLRRVATETRESLALTAGTDEAQHFYEVILTTTQQVGSAEAAARECTGSALYIGDTDIQTNFDPGIPEADTTDSGVDLPGAGPIDDVREEYSPVI